MNIIKINSMILVLYLYITSISILLAPFISTFIVKSILLLLLILITLFVNKFKINLKIILIFSFLLLFICINLFAVDHKDYVIADGVNFLMYSFIPIYLLTQRIVSFTYVRDYWIKLAVIFTCLIPLYYLYRKNAFISYYDVGFLSHLNTLIIAYILISSKKKSTLLLIFLAINIVVSTILGSRMVLIASLITTIFTYIIFANKRTIKFYFNLILLGFLGFIVSMNLLNILNSVNDIISKFGINSRNLSLFIAQLNGRYDDSVILSGRDDIYPVITQYLYENGILPSGFGIARKLTNGAYYHSHNFFMELVLIFGMFGFIIILIIFLLKVTSLIRFRRYLENNLMLNFLFVFLISFLIRSLTGTYFVTDTIFLICFGIILSINKKTLKKFNKVKPHK